MEEEIIQEQNNENGNVQKKKINTKNLVLLAVFLALVILLQSFASYIKIGATSISLVLIPIVLGGVILGPFAGAFLGFAFGLVTLVAGIIGADPFTAILFSEHPFLTSILCLLKGTCAGFVAALLYKVVAKKNRYAAVFCASATAPIVNTLLFILGALFMSDTISGNFVSEGSTVIYFLVIVCAGVNFLIELFVNLIISPALYSLSNIYKSHRY